MNTEHFKQKLEEERARIETELKTVGVQNPENPKDWEPRATEMDTMAPAADANEAADKIEEFEETSAVNDALEIRYNNIKDALARIEKGTYGVCEEGGEQIEEDRLEANPAARTCKAHMGDEDK